MPWSYRPALDGVRSVAVYLVLLFHAGIQDVAGGFVGVDLFFVLSGFLVSNVILSEIDQTGRLDLGRFYARRVRRLLPAAVVVIVATSLMFLLLTSVVRRLPLIGDAQSALLYVANWRFLSQQNDYFASDVHASPFLHFWSLAIEEQFYLFFPVLLLVLVRVARRRRLTWAPVAGVTALFVASLASQLFWGSYDPNWAYYGTDARLYQLLAGVLLALALRATTRRLADRQADAVAVLGLLGLLAASTGHLDVTPTVRGILATVTSVMLIGGLMTAETGLLSRVLSTRLPVYLGKISYGTYLWHWPVILVAGELLDVRPFVLAVLAGAVSTGMAAASFEILEMPIRTAAPLRRFRWSVLTVGVATSAVVATTLVPAVLESDRQPRVARAATSLPEGPQGKGAPRKERMARVPKGIDWEAAAEGEGTFDQCTPEDPDGCVIHKGSGPHLALIGDSHAKMLEPMLEQLAEEKDLTLSINTMGACPWQTGVVNKRLTGPRRDSCLERRQEWYDEVLPRLDPDVVVLGSLSRDDRSFWKGKLVRTDGEPQDLPDLLRSTSSSTALEIANTGSRVLIVESMPVSDDGNPLECLATASRLYQCEVRWPEKAPASDGYYRAAAKQSKDVYTVNLTSVFCKGRPHCLPVVDGIVVWRDPHHFTKEITLHFRDRVWNRIKESGVLQGLSRKQ